MFEIRTDLAIEEKTENRAEQSVAGVSCREWREPSSMVKMTEVKILDEHGARALRKPVGTYLTLEAKTMGKKDEDYHREVSEELAAQLVRMIREIQRKEEKARSAGKVESMEWWRKQEEQKEQKEQEQSLKGIHLLVVGLGNAQVTPDALGPEVLKHLKITVYEPKKKENDRTNRDTTNGDRKEWNKSLDVENCRTGWDGKSQDDERTILTGIVPGVMAQTGMETAQIMRGIVRETKPDLVIAIDALAARSIRRLGTTIQVTDTGIHPGSGVGNHRHGLTRESLGVPVIAIGVPTVVGTAAIVHDTVSVLIQTLLEHAQTREIGGFLDQLDSDEQYRLICELLEPEFGQMYVTPPDIDQTIKAISYTISEAIHMAFFGGVKMDKRNDAAGKKCR